MWMYPSGGCTSETRTGDVGRKDGDDDNGSPSGESHGTVSNPSDRGWGRGLSESEGTDGCYHRRSIIRRSRHSTNPSYRHQ